MTKEMDNPPLNKLESKIDPLIEELDQLLEQLKESGVDLECRFDEVHTAPLIDSNNAPVSETYAVDMYTVLIDMNNQMLHNIDIDALQTTNCYLESVLNGLKQNKSLETIAKEVGIKLEFVHKTLSTVSQNIKDNSDAIEWVKVRYPAVSKAMLWAQGLRFAENHDRRLGNPKNIIQHLINASTTLASSLTIFRAVLEVEYQVLLELKKYETKEESEK